MSRSTVRESAADRIFLGIVYLFLSVVLIVILFPLLHIVSASFSSPGAVSSGKVWLWPVDVTLIGYKAVFQNSNILTGFGNSLFYAVVGTIVNVAFTVMLAYPLARKTFYVRNIIMMLLVFTMFFDGGLIPKYLLVKNMGLLDTYWALIIPSAMTTWNLIIMRTAFQGVPDALEESARIDGASDWTILFRIIIPLSLPVIAVMVLFYGVWHWNKWFDALIYLRDRDLFPLQLILREILIQNDTSSMMTSVGGGDRMPVGETIKYATIMVATLPILFLYPFLQKYFVKGVMIGAIKE